MNLKSYVAMKSWTGIDSPSCLGREGQLDSERRAPTNLRSKVYRTIVKLDNSECACEADPAAAGPRREKQLENFLPVLQWNSFPGVAHGNFRHFAAAAQHQPHLSAAGHGLRRVQHQIQHGLLEQRAVHINFRYVNRQQLRQLNIGLLQLRLRNLQHFFQQDGKLRCFQTDVHRPRKIEETFDNRVEPVNIFVQDLYRLLRCAVGLGGKRFLQVFQPQAHRVQWILHFVRDARGDPATRGQAFAHLELRVDALQGIEVAPGDQRAHALAVFLNGLYADADALGPFAGLQLGFRRYFAQLIAFNAKSIAQGMSRRKYLRNPPPKKMPCGSAKKL